MQKNIFLLIALLFVPLAYGAPAKQPTMAVLPFQLSPVVDTTHIGEVEITRTLAEREFSNQLIQFLEKSRKFNMLTRTQINKVMAENRLTESYWAEPGQIELMGKLLVADYLVTGVINRLEVSAVRQNITITGETLPRLVATFKSQFQIIQSSTGKIVLADQVIQKIRFDQIRREIPSSERRYWTVADYSDLLFTKAATEVGNAILAGIYPIKVIKVSSTGVVLNRGKGVGLEVGKQCKVVSQGEAIIDADTGEALGGYEEQVGIIEVTSVEGKFSKAKIISGAGRIHYGDICRLLQTEIRENDAAYPRVTPGW
ncbi:CsgG/HfaB family protein [Bathymodiolus japonicus methanotrophic gill symbiont]|uniref:CsgG/HfaB family protein n=1 Tax=Bathymodiolus japonicus methanotrophic gill symbiont TaxID=113269 RepID=UPI001C8DBCD6|nr:CsgG/HfaB family protein [Bathymodiolus japonicus methanotrophic gill symbiont]